MNMDNTRFHLTTEQIAQYDKDGFLHLPQHLDLELLKPLQRQTKEMIADAMNHKKNGESTRDYTFTYSFFTPYLNRILNYHRRAGLGSLAVMASPEIMGIAESLCGHNMVSSAEMLTLKHKGNMTEIPWHQDLFGIAPEFRVVTIGIYLDESLPGGGSVKFLPGTQHGKQDISKLAESAQDNMKELVIKPGDIVLHNPQVVHCSDLLKEQQLRRTLYYEFRSMEQIEAEESWPEKLVQNRLSLMETAFAQFKKQFPHKPQFQWRLNRDKYHAQVTDDLGSLYDEPIPAAPANYDKALVGT